MRSLRLFPRVAGSLTLLALAALAQAAPPAAFTATEMMKLHRLADPQVSPDGKRVLYVATQVDAVSNARNSDLWVVPLAGGDPRRLTAHPKSDSRGRWSPDGKRIAFVSSREGGSQVWIVDAAGGQERQATTLPTEAAGVSWVDDRHLLVTSDVFPECDASGGRYDAACQKRHLDAAGKGSSARVY